MSSQFDDLLAELNDYQIPPEETVVLVIDDEPMILGTMQKVLARAGYVVLTAETAELGLDMLETDDPPQVVITDKNLPGIDGLEVIRRGKALLPNTEFILMTGYASIESSIKAIEIGASGYLQKPFDLKVVITQVEVALGKHVAAHQNRMLTERLRAVCTEQVGLKNERDLLKSFVDGQVSGLLAGLKAQFEEIERLSASSDLDSPIQQQLESASRTLSDFAHAHRGLRSSED